MTKPSKAKPDATDLEKGAVNMARAIDMALRREIEKRGPLLIWSGDGEFPREGCKFRGLSVGNGRNRLTLWLGVRG